MKLFSEDDLIAYHLGELPARRAQQLEETLQVHGELAAESAAIAETLQAYRGHTPADLHAGAADRAWFALQAKLQPAAAPKTRTSPRWRFPALAGAAALATAGVVAYFATRPLQTRQDDGLPTHGTSLRPNTNSARQETHVTDHATHQSEGGRLAGHHAARGQVFARRETLLPGGMLPQEQLAQRGAVVLAAPAHVQGRGEPVTAPAAVPNRDTSVPSSLSASAVASDGTAQSAGSSSHRKKARAQMESDVTLAMGGTFLPLRESNGANAYVYGTSSTHAIAGLAAFHQQLHPFAGYRITASYTRPGFDFSRRTTGTNSSTGSYEINGRVFEIAGTYVVQGPRRGRLRTSADAGVGVMVISPTIHEAETSRNVRVAAVLGAAAEVDLTKHLALRGAYRGQVFNGPDFNATSYYADYVRATTVMTHEPSLGLTWRFTQKNN